MEINHQFSYKDLFEKAKQTLDEAGISYSSEFAWSHPGGPMLRITNSSTSSAEQNKAFEQLNLLISEDKKRLTTSEHG